MTSVDISAVRVDFRMKFYTTVKQENTTLHHQVWLKYNCNWGSCIARRAHHRVNTYPGARRIKQKIMFSDHDETKYVDKWQNYVHPVNTRSNCTKFNCGWGFRPHSWTGAAQGREKMERESDKLPHFRGVAMGRRQGHTPTPSHRLSGFLKGKTGYVGT